MANDPTPDDVLALLYELTEAGNRREREAEQAAVHRRLVNVAGIDHLKLSTQGQRILRWLADWDERTTGGLIEILTATRSTAIENTRRDHTKRPAPEPAPIQRQGKPEGLSL